MIAENYLYLCVSEKAVCCPVLAGQDANEPDSDNTFSEHAYHKKTSYPHS